MYLLSFFFIQQSILTITSLTLFLGTVLAYPYPDPDPVSKTTSQHSLHALSITTTLGEVKGTLSTTRLGKTIHAFQGLRYAKAPIKELRFKPPVPAEKWDNIFNATIDGAACPQPNMEHTSEDCLFLNVYTTKIPKGSDNPKRPVLVYFHQGEFQSYSGKSSDIGPQYLLDQDIVLVTPNYRLGALGWNNIFSLKILIQSHVSTGFLSTGDKEAPGNYGLKDQVQALKWVKENIAAFGGDPDAVTIAGYCAGAASVSLHLVSPLSKDLFDKAIVMSGSVYGNWPLASNQLDLAKRQAKLVGCTDETSAGIVKCLREKSAEEIANSLPGLKEFGKEPIIQWSPVIEQDFGQSRFLTASPIELALKGKMKKVPILAGITADEFGGRAFDLISNETLLNDLDKEFEKYAPIAFIYERGTEKSKTISKSLKSFYFKDKRIDKTSLPALAQLFSDSLVGFNVNKFVEVMSQENDKVMPIKEPCELLDNVKWDPYKAGTQFYMDIGNKLVLSEKLFDERYEFWRKLYPRNEIVTSTG
ncbi:carboxylesterase [Holotrichia oblita]|uniref:Carboxylesterase n=1 Tax=Holotrichia oblita TaxID=644536 RepID=A0ACB9SNJ0_HOLOL|nr:carboxylesterase [Holotrichia oblita]